MRIGALLVQPLTDRFDSEKRVDSIPQNKLKRGRLQALPCPPKGRGRLSQLFAFRTVPRSYRVAFCFKRQSPPQGLFALNASDFCTRYSKLRINGRRFSSPAA